MQIRAAGCIDIKFHVYVCTNACKLQLEKKGGGIGLLITLNSRHKCWRIPSIQATKIAHKDRVLPQGRDVTALSVCTHG